MTKTSWAQKVEEMMEPGEQVVGCSRSDEEMAVEFNDDFGVSEGVSFTAWSASRVFFPVVYDGMEWVGSAPRNPCDEHTGHQGGA